VPVVSTIPTERYGRAHLDDPALRASRIRAAQLVDIATARLTRRIHAVSAHVAQATSQHLRYPRHRIDVVHRGRPATLADAHPVDRAWVRASLGVGDRKVVMTVARLDQAKGLDRVLTAWPELLRSVPDACLLLAGPEAGQGPALRSLAAELGIESTVQFLGHRTDVADLLRACDAFVLPSRREGLPGALIEAMATATPAVVSDLPQVTEIVNADEALIVDAADPSALAAAIADTVSDPGRARQRADRSQRRFRRELTLDRSADGMASFYRRSLDLTEAPVAIPPGTE
jgi:glycosyltransferase involved in cell wall biosynthesis